MTTNREGIIDNIVNTLSAISTSNDYLTDIETVSRTIISWDELLAGSSKLPYICVMPEQATVIYQQMYSIKLSLPIYIVAVQNATGEENKTEILSNIVTDIIQAMLYDQSQDGNAISTNLVDVTTDEGDPDATDSYGHSAIAVLHFNVVYENDTRHYTTPTFWFSSVDGATLTALWKYTSNHIDTFNTASVPKTTDFTVTGSNSGAMTISDVTISGSNVILSLSSSVDTYESVTFSYTGGSNSLVSYNGELEAADLTSKIVTNTTYFIIDDTLTTDDTGVYVYLPVNDIIDQSSVPDTTDFNLTGSLSGSIAVSAVTIQSSPDRVRLTVGSFSYADTLTLDYTEGVELIYNTDQSQSIVAFSSRAVTNNKPLEADHIIGMYASSDVTSNGFILDYPVALDETSVPATTDFTIEGSVSGSATIQSVAVSRERVKVSIIGTITTSQTISITYTKGVNPIRESTGVYNADDITASAIAKWEPGYLSISNQTDNNKLYLTYAEELSNATPSTSAFTAAGSITGPLTISDVLVDGEAKIVRLTTSVFENLETVTVTYIRPESNAIESYSYSGVYADDITSTECIISIP